MRATAGCAIATITAKGRQTARPHPRPGARTRAGAAVGARAQRDASTASACCADCTRICRRSNKPPSAISPSGFPQARRQLAVPTSPKEETMSQPDHPKRISSSSAAAMRPRQLCAATRRMPGRAHGSTLVCAEAVLPYQRPPLSKSFLKEQRGGRQPHRAEPGMPRPASRVQPADPAVEHRPRRHVACGCSRERSCL